MKTDPPLALPPHRQPTTSRLEPPSILVLTKDEEINIAACLETLSFSDDIVVLDSFSSDRTLEIAAGFPNVRIIQRKFDNWSSHSNWALTNIQFKHPWVYYSDADERVTPELRDEICRVINDPQRQEVAYRLRYKNILMNRWLRRGGIYPVWIIRLFRPDCVRYEQREVNAHPIVNGKLGDLQEHFIHYSFNKGLLAWFAKHNGYSDMEAQEAVRVRKNPMLPLLRTALVAKDAERRRAVKNLSFFLPMRSMVRFLYMYLLKLGILDGGAGLAYARMIAVYESWITAKVHLMEYDWHSRTEVLANALSYRHGMFCDQVVRTPVSVVILTRDEETNIRECLESCAWSDDVHVVDSGSTDRTRQIAREHGAQVHEHAFVSFGEQRNWAIDNIRYKHSWILHLDADERCTAPLVRKMDQTLRANPPEAGYYLPQKLLFMGRWIRWASGYPTYQMRLFHKDRMRFSDYGHGQREATEGTLGYLREPYLHLPFRKGLSDWINKHNQYSELEAKVGVSLLRQKNLWKRILLGDRITRHRAWKELAYRLPMRAAMRWVATMFVGGGLLDGKAGWMYASLLYTYETMITIKMRFMQGSKGSLPNR